MVPSSDLLFFGIVVAARLLAPLIIPRYPLPGVVAALLLDAVDQTLFQSFTSLPLDGYQGYDKALDIYYLSIAYIATLGNWTNPFAFGVARLLFYWRLVGVALFELSGLRALLFVFPNTFEYFFIWYETLAVWRDPTNLPRRTIVGAAAAIWVVIKLPQEFWLHIARLDVTDVLKTALFGAAPDTTWGYLFTLWPGVFIGAIVGAVLLIGGLAWLAARRLPRPAGGLSFAAAHRSPPPSRDRLRAARALWSRTVFDRELAEKLLLVTLIVVIFARILPNTRATDAQVAAGSVVVIVLNTALSHWLARRGVGWKNIIGQFVVMAAANTTIVALFQLGAGPRDLDDAAAGFFILLLSLILTLFDRALELRLARGKEESADFTDFAD